jgi:hypothetical protein
MFLNRPYSGELEITMLKSFCAAANLRALVQSGRCPNIIQTCAHLLDECYGQDQRGTLANDLRTLDNSLNEDVSDQAKAWDYDRDKFERLEPAIYEALVSFVHSHSIEGWTAGTHALLHKDYMIRGLQFAELKAGGKNTKGRHSIIFFQPTTDTKLVPGVIRKIFSMPRNQHGVEMQVVFLAVHRYERFSTSDGEEDPFSQYDGFGAGLWSEKLCPLEIITPAQKICHATLRRWKDGVNVLRPIDRVRRPFLNANKAEWNHLFASTRTSDRHQT